MPIKISASIKGFNLPELIISILFLSTVIIIIIGIFTGGVLGMKKGSNNVLITNALQASLDHYCQEILYDFNNPLYGNNLRYKIAEVKPLGSLTIEEEWVAFKEGGSSPKNRMKEVTVTIYWFDQNLSGATSLKDRSLSTWVNNYLDY